MYNYSRNVRTYNSYKKKRRGFLFQTFRFIIILFILYEAITLIFLSSYTVRTEAMAPGIVKNQKILSVPFIFGLQIPFTRLTLPGIRNPERGDIVILTPPNHLHYPWYLSLGDTVVRFFTLQEKGILPKTGPGSTNEIAVKRIIGIPGDTVKVENFTAYIKPRGSSNYIKEDALISKKVERKTGLLPAGWGKEEPYAGNYPPVTLHARQYFVLNDNRQDRNDSRFFGVLQRKDIYALVVLKYLPGFSLP